MMKVIFIGASYYSKSHTVMSSTYQIDDAGLFERTDWGKIHVALENGEEVHIRPASKEELDQMDICLAKIIISRAENEQ